jgi:hypothetical protein
MSSNEIKELQNKLKKFQEKLKNETDSEEKQRIQTKINQLELKITQLQGEGSGTQSFAKCKHCNKKFSALTGNKAIEKLNDHYCLVLKSIYKNKMDSSGGSNSTAPIQNKNSPTYLLVIGGICLVIGLIGLF